MKKLLLIGSNAGKVHLKNFLGLVQSYFDDILVVSDYPVDFAPSKRVSFSLRNPINIYRSIQKLRSIIKEFQPTIIHVHQVNSYAYISGKANTFNIPMVLTAWGSDVLLLPKKSMFHRWLVKQGLKRAKIITADSYQMKSVILALCPTSTVVNANFGVNVDLTTALSAARETVIYSNRMHEPLYQVVEILEGFKDYVSSTPAEMIIAGSGSLTEKLQAIAAKEHLTSHLTFVGFVTKSKNKENYLKSKFFVSIPTSDGTSISLLEAMAYGCIPILSDIPANNEWIDDGVNGIIKKEGESLAHALTRSAQLDASTVQAINRKIIIERATKEANKKIFLSIYDALIASADKAKR